MGLQVNGAALGVDWIKLNVDTVVEAFEGGMYAGVALADPHAPLES